MYVHINKYVPYIPTYLPVRYLCIYGIYNQNTKTFLDPVPVPVLQFTIHTIGTSPINVMPTFYTLKQNKTR